MIRRASIALAVIVAFVLGSLPAGAMCRPGRIGIDPRTGKPVIELPHCDPPPQ